MIEIILANVLIVIGILAFGLMAVAPFFADADATQADGLVKTNR